MDDVTQGGLIAAGLAVGIGVWLWIDRLRHPKSKCRTCKGAGRLHSSWTQRWRDCPDCDGGVRDSSK